MQSEGENLVQTTWHSILRQANNLTAYIKEVSAPHIQKVATAMPDLSPYLEKGKQFYSEHKEAVLIVAVASVMYLVMRPPKKEDEKGRKKKTAIKQIAPKSFISDNEEPDYAEQPSTATRKSADSSGQEVRGGRKGTERKILERIDSSSEEDEEDKIFFEVYKKYQAQQQQ